MLQAYASEWENYSLLTYHLPLPFNLIERQRNTQPAITGLRKNEPPNAVRNVYFFEILIHLLVFNCDFIKNNFIVLFF